MYFFHFWWESKKVAHPTGYYNYSAVILLPSSSALFSCRNAHSIFSPKIFCVSPQHSPESLLDMHNVVIHSLSPAWTPWVAAKPCRSLPLWCCFYHPAADFQASNHDDKWNDYDKSPEQKWFDGKSVGLLWAWAGLFSPSNQRVRRQEHVPTPGI